MKNVFYIALLLNLILFGCSENGEKFSGSPLNNGAFESISVNVSTTESVVSGAQLFPFSVSIPNALNFDSEVEVVVTGQNLSQRRAKVVIPAGSLSVQGNISAPVPIDSGSYTSTFTQSCNLIVSAFNNPSNAQKVYYKVVTNTVVLQLGDSSVPISTLDRCIVRLSCNGPWNGIGGALPLINNIDMVVKRNGVPYTAGNPANIPPATGNQITTSVNERTESFSIMNSYQDGLFTFEPYFSAINSSSVNCRFTIAFPNNTFKSVNFSESGLSAPSLPLERLKIKKETLAGVVSYTILP